MAVHAYSLFRRLVSVQLAALVLLTSVGLTVQRLTCHMGGQRAVAVSVARRTELRGGLGELAPATASAKDGCCDCSKQEHRLYSPAHALTTKALVPVPALLLAAPGHWRP